MTSQEWAAFKPYFTAKECGKGMKKSFMEKVLVLRIKIDTPMFVHDGFSTKGHSPGSYHYGGRALDFHTALNPRYIMSIIDSLGIFGGVGFYPWWNNQGFHIDDRPLPRYQRWVSPRKGEYIYLLEDAP